MPFGHPASKNWLIPVKRHAARTLRTMFYLVECSLYFYMHRYQWMWHVGRQFDMLDVQQLATWQLYVRLWLWLHCQRQHHVWRCIGRYTTCHWVKCLLFPWTSVHNNDIMWWYLLLLLYLLIFLLSLLLNLKSIRFCQSVLTINAILILFSLGFLKIVHLFLFLQSPTLQIYLSFPVNSTPLTKNV